jgi:hypothetical protein
MIYKFIGSSTSDRFIGTTYSGITFSATLGVRVSGLSGSALIHKYVIKNANNSSVGDSTPVLLVSPPVGGTTNYTLPDTTSIINGSVFIYRRTDTSSTPGANNIYVGDSIVQAFRLVGSSTNATDISTGLNESRCFFYAFNRWWQY